MPKLSSWVDENKATDTYMILFVKEQKPKGIWAMFRAAACVISNGTELVARIEFPKPASPTVTVNAITWATTEVSFRTQRIRMEAGGAFASIKISDGENDSWKVILPQGRFVLKRHGGGWGMFAESGTLCLRILHSWRDSDEEQGIVARLEVTDRNTTMESLSLAFCLYRAIQALIALRSS